MKKKVLSCLLCAAMAFRMAACGEEPTTDFQSESMEESGEESTGDDQQGSEGSRPLRSLPRKASLPKKSPPRRRSRKGRRKAP